MIALVKMLAPLQALKLWHALAVAFVAWTGWVSVKAYRAGGAAVVERSKEEGKKNAAAAEKAHARARTPGAAERLRKTDCRDC